MTTHTKIHVFTPEQLREHDKNIATKIHQMTVKSTVRKMNKMNPAQQLQSASHGAKSLYWSEDKLDKALAYIENE